MSNPGDIHLTGRPAYEPRAREIFQAALAKFRKDYHGQGIENAFRQVVDLAERMFLDACDAAYTRNPDLFIARIGIEGPRHARFCILEMVLRWEKAGTKRSKEGKRR